MPKITLAGENSILIYFGDKIDASLPEKIANFANQLQTTLKDSIINITPSYTSLLVSYNLNKMTYHAFKGSVESLLTRDLVNYDPVLTKTTHIPVFYDKEVGLDLERLLDEKQMDLDTFIQIHSQTEYLVHAIGFAPGFAFLAEVDERIQAPRLDTPRVKIPKGSVAIADLQTAIYPTESSGGWNIIGRTLIDLSLDNPENLDKFQVGDKVKFYPITREEYIAHGGQI